MLDETVGPVVETEDALLLREFGHRAMNDLAVARSAVAVTRRALGGSGPVRLAVLLDEADQRLDGAGRLMLLLAEPVPPRVDLGGRLAALCAAALDARRGSACAMLRADLPEVWVDGILARRVMLIAAELVANASRHGLAGRSGTIRVTLRRSGEGLVLQVADDGRPGDVQHAGTGLGGGIVAGLARLAGGTVHLDCAPGGAVATLRIPLLGRQEISVGA